VLPEETLRRVERHTRDVMAHREALREAGQHLKRGLLLFGPPGTGKTHTTRYVVQQLRGATVILLSGQSLHAVGMVAQMARDLQPAVLVLEDVDLVAEDRGFGQGPNPVLFSLLDAMDGAAADADVLFLLTTNRADLLEPALAARPHIKTRARTNSIPRPARSTALAVRSVSRHLVKPSGAVVDAVLMEPQTLYLLQDEPKPTRPLCFSWRPATAAANRHGTQSANRRSVE
jgi:SpoVK/Ycf46/Vps4 family AAA+-type ATPase